jgi:hypothetical protein
VAQTNGGYFVPSTLRHPDWLLLSSGFEGKLQDSFRWKSLLGNIDSARRAFAQWWLFRLPGGSAAACGVMTTW